MYEDFYQLKSKPFSLVPDPDYLFLSQKHKTALVYLEYGIIEQAGFMVITGEIGTGKTTLIKYLLSKLAEIDPGTRVAYIFNTNLTPQEFLKAVLQELGIPSPSEYKTDILGALNQFLIQQYASRHKVALIIDEAQNLSLATLEEIRMLSNLQTDKDHLLQIILVGQPALRDHLRHPQLNQFSQRVTVNYHLAPLDQSETTDYIHHRLKVSSGDAARDGTPLFTEEAISTIYRYSNGIPRIINILCDAALVYGFAEEKREIDPPLIEQVMADKRQGGIFDPEREIGAGELPMQEGERAEAGLEYRVAALERAFSELQQKVLSALHNFSRHIEHNGNNTGIIYRTLANKLENQLIQEQKKNEMLHARLQNYKAQLQGLIKKRMELEDELLHVKNQITPSSVSWLKKRLSSLF